MTARDRIVIVALTVIALIAGFWFGVLAPKRDEAARVDAEIAAQRERLRTTQATVAAGDEARARYEADYAALAKLGKALPADDELVSLMYQLETAARGAKVDFRSIKRSAGQAAAPPTAQAASSASHAPAGSSGTQAGGTAGAPSPTGSASAAAALPPGATVGTAGLATLPFSLTFRGSYFELERFLRELQEFVVARDGEVSVRGRLLTIDGVSLVPSSTGLGSIQASVAATAYLQPGADATSAAGGTSPGDPGSSSTPGSGTTAAAPAQTASAMPSGAS